MKQALIVIVLVVVGVVAAWKISSGKGIGGPAPDFTLYSTRGRAVSLSELQGKVVVLDFWASWCPPCRAAIPSMQRLHEVYKDRGVEVLGINMNDNQDPAEFMAKLGVDYKVLRDGAEVAQLYNVKAIPTLLVIAPDGTVVLRDQGWGSGFEARIASAIESHLPE